jgi:replicative DNA helicase
VATKNKINEKLPPQNIEAEISVLGSMLIEESAISLAIEVLEEGCFYKDAHRIIFSAIVELYSTYKPVDVITLTDHLKKKELVEKVGGAAYITQLAGAVPTAANVKQYAKIVKEKALLRGLINAATDIASESYDDSIDADVLLDKAEQKIFEISTNKVDSGFVPIREVVRDTIENIDSLYQKKGLVTGIPTGFEQLDKITAGMQKSDLIILAGRPSMGKSALAGCIAEHVGLTERVPVVIFSLEMSKEHFVQRLLCSHAKVNAQNVRTGFLSQSDWPKLTAAAGKLSESPIIIDDTPGISVLELRAKARRLKSQHNIGLIILDYLQLMQGRDRVESRQQEISEISRALKGLAKELNVPLIAVSQLSRAPERREDNRPKLSDLRESGAIEQDADLVLLLFREEFYNPGDEAIKGLADVIIAKQRNGPIGNVNLAFLKEYTRFETLSRRQEQE